jgi:hypothetical protein
VVDHHPCEWSEASGKQWDRKIEFAPMSVAPFTRDDANPNCYIMGGPVNFYDDIRGNLMM